MTTDATLDARAEHSGRVRPRQTLLVSVVGLAIAAAIAVPLAITSGGHPARPNGGSPPAGEATYNGLTLHYPTTWHTVEPTFITAAASYPLGWITNGEPGPQCTKSGCHGPVTHLGSGIVQISVTSAGLFTARDFATDTRLAGLPARRTENVRCDPSAVSGFAIIAEETPTSGVVVTACFGPNTSAQQAQVRDMLATAIYRRA